MNTTDTRDQELYLSMLPTTPGDVLTIDIDALQWTPETYARKVRMYMDQARAGLWEKRQAVAWARAHNRAYIAARKDLMR